MRGKIDHGPLREEEATWVGYWEIAIRRQRINGDQHQAISVPNSQRQVAYLELPSGSNQEVDKYIEAVARHV